MGRAPVDSPWFVLASVKGIGVGALVPIGLGPRSGTLAIRLHPSLELSASEPVPGRATPSSAPIEVSPKYFLYAEPLVGGLLGIGERHHAEVLRYAPIVRVLDETRAVARLIRPQSQAFSHDGFEAHDTSPYCEGEKKREMADHLPRFLDRHPVSSREGSI